MPDASVSAHEQLMLELVNRARLDPVAEAVRLGATNIAGMNLPLGSLSPLAGNAQLSLSSAVHSEWMLATDTFSHTGANNSSAGERMADAGYVFSGSWSWGENLAYRTSGGTLNVTQSVLDLHRALFFSDGHRGNILSDGFREIGIGQEFGNFAGLNATTITQNYARSGQFLFLTGVVYDDLNGDAFYSVGEGRGGAIFLTTSGSDTSASAGGYAVRITPGSQIVTIDLPQSGQTLLRLDSVTGNVKLDVVNGTALHVSTSATLLSGVATLQALGTQDLSLTGNAEANLLIGNSGDNRFDGGGGSDTIIGGGGVDTAVIHGALSELSMTVSVDGVSITTQLGTSLYRGITWFDVGGSLFDTTGLLAAVTQAQHDAMPEDPPPGEDAGPDMPAPDTDAGQGVMPPVPSDPAPPAIIEVDAMAEQDPGLDPDAIADPDPPPDPPAEQEQEPDTPEQPDEPEATTADAVIQEASPADQAPQPTAVPVDPADWPTGAILGTSGDENLPGTEADDLIVGGGGDDHIAARAGNDTVYGGDGNDTIGGGLGNDLIHAGDGDDIAVGGRGNDTIHGGAGSDTIGGGWGRDLLYGDAGDDLLSGGPGDDSVYGGDGNDRIGGGSGRDLIFGGAGNDVIGAGADDDTIYGGAGDDFIGGGAGDDLIFGGSGNDTLQPGEGSDTLWGGTGADLFVFNAAHTEGRVMIMDFEQGTDLIRINGIGLSPANVMTRVAPQAFGDGGQSGVMLVVSGREIVVLGVSPEALSPEDFWLG